ncbi:TPA: hypothetical protein HA251_02765 [Candidatus Woesearchaeota archaeon]|nr:hypothetical protein [Candidatus Woesearchaeota archaeon]
MDVTTIKLQKCTKRKLDALRKETESYDSVVERLVAMAKREHLKAALIAGYSDPEQKKIMEEWDGVTGDGWK